MFWDFLVFYCKMLRVSINHKFSLSVISWHWLLVVGCSLNWIFVRAVNLLAFLEVVCVEGLPLLERLPILPVVEAEVWEVYTKGQVFMDWDFCCGLGRSLISLEPFFLRRLVFKLTLCKCGIFCYFAFNLRYFFFLCLHCLSNNVWASLYNGHFCVLFWRYSENPCKPKQASHFVFFWQ